MMGSHSEDEFQDACDCRVYSDSQTDRNCSLIKYQESIVSGNDVVSRIEKQLNSLVGDNERIQIVCMKREICKTNQTTPLNESKALEEIMDLSNDKVFREPLKREYHDCSKHRIEELMAKESKMKRKLEEYEIRQTAILETISKGDEMWADLENSYKQKIDEHYEKSLTSALERDFWRAKCEEHAEKVKDMVKHKLKQEEEREIIEKEIKELITQKDILSEQVVSSQLELLKTKNQMENKEMALQKELTTLRSMIDSLQGELMEYKKMQIEIENSFFDEVTLLKQNLNKAHENLGKQEVYKEKLTAEVYELEKELIDVSDELLKQKAEVDEKNKSLLEEIWYKGMALENLEAQLTITKQAASTKKINKQFHSYKFPKQKPYKENVQGIVTKKEICETDVVKFLDIEEIYDIGNYVQFIPSNNRHTPLIGPKNETSVKEIDTDNEQKQDTSPIMSTEPQSSLNQVTKSKFQINEVHKADKTIALVNMKLSCDDSKHHITEIPQNVIKIDPIRRKPKITPIISPRTKVEEITKKVVKMGVDLKHKTQRKCPPLHQVDRGDSVKNELENNIFNKLNNSLDNYCLDEYSMTLYHQLMGDVKNLFKMLRELLKRSYLDSTLETKIEKLYRENKLLQDKNLKLAFQANYIKAFKDGVKSSQRGGGKEVTENGSETGNKNNNQNILPNVEVPKSDQQYGPVDSIKPKSVVNCSLYGQPLWRKEKMAIPLRANRVIMDKTISLRTSIKPYTPSAVRKPNDTLLKRNNEALGDIINSTIPKQKYKKTENALVQYDSYIKMTEEHSLTYRMPRKNRKILINRNSWKPNTPTNTTYNLVPIAAKIKKPKNLFGLLSDVKKSELGSSKTILEKNLKCIQKNDKINIVKNLSSKTTASSMTLDSDLMDIQEYVESFSNNTLVSNSSSRKISASHTESVHNTTPTNSNIAILNIDCEKLTKSSQNQLDESIISDIESLRKYSTYDLSVLTVDAKESVNSLKSFDYALSVTKKLSICNTTTTNNELNKNIISTSDTEVINISEHIDNSLDSVVKEKKGAIKNKLEINLQVVQPDLNEMSETVLSLDEISESVETLCGEIETLEQLLIEEPINKIVHVKKFRAEKSKSFPIMNEETVECMDKVMTEPTEVKQNNATNGKNNKIPKCKSANTYFNDTETNQEALGLITEFTNKLIYSESMHYSPSKTKSISTTGNKKNFFLCKRLADFNNIEDITEYESVQNLNKICDTYTDESNQSIISGKAKNKRKQKRSCKVTTERTRLTIEMRNSQSFLADKKSSSGSIENVKSLLSKVNAEVIWAFEKAEKQSVDILSTINSQVYDSLSKMRALSESAKNKTLQLRSSQNVKT